MSHEYRGVLSDTTLKTLVEKGELISNLTDFRQIQPASIDVRLGNSFFIPESKTYFVLGEALEGKTVIQDSYTLAPHEFILATTREIVKLPSNVSAFIDGRSSVGRSGIFIENAGWIDPGFEGEITLEIYNATESYVTLMEGTRIAQIVFMWNDLTCSTPYEGKYNNQSGATPPQMYKDYENDIGGLL